MRLVSLRIQFEENQIFWSRYLTRKGSSSYLITRYVQTGLRITEITNRWHFLHAIWIILTHTLWENWMLLRLGFDVYFKIHLSGFFISGRRARGRWWIGVTVHTVVIIVLMLTKMTGMGHHRIVLMRLGDMMAIHSESCHLIFGIIKILSRGSHKLTRSWSWGHGTPRILPSWGQSRWTFQCRHNYSHDSLVLWMSKEQLKPVLYGRVQPLAPLLPIVLVYYVLLPARFSKQQSPWAFERAISRCPDPCVFQKRVVSSSSNQQHILYDDGQ